MLHTTFRAFNAIVLTLLMAACGSVPKSHIGSFGEPSTTLLDLKADSMVFAHSGDTLNAAILDFDVNRLATLEPAVYAIPNTVNTNLTDVYGVFPKTGEIIEEATYSWYQARIVFFVINNNLQGEVEHLHVVYADDGRVMIKPDLRLWQVGWPSGQMGLLLSRESK